MIDLKNILNNLSQDDFDQRPTTKRTKGLKQMDKEYERLVTYNFINWFWTQEHLKKNIQTASHAYMSWLEATRQADERNKTNFIE